eukprot:556556-Hanusia_phi.AAC.4
MLSRYDGPTLIELIDILRPPPRPVDLPLRLSISDVFKTQSMGSCVAGRIEAGTLAPGGQVLVRPGDLTANVKGKHLAPVAETRAGAECPAPWQQSGDGQGRRQCDRRAGVHRLRSSTGWRLPMPP